MKQKDARAWVCIQSGEALRLEMVEGEEVG